MSQGIYFVNAKTNQKIAVNGCIRSNDRPDCKEFENYVQYQPGALPAIADLRPYMPQVENQLTTRSCVANALAGAFEYLLRRGASNDLDMSRLFLYYNARARNPMYSQWMYDMGCYITDAIASLQADGTCNEKNWPFEIMNINSRPPAANYQEARSYTILQPVSVKRDLHEMKSCLAQGYPFVFGAKLFISFYESERNGGWVPMPGPNDSVAGQHGDHAMLAVGYIDERSVFIVRNSWGPTWGDKGYIYMRYEYMTDPNLVYDAYTIQKFSSIDLGQAHWKRNISELEFAGPTNYGSSADDAGEDDWSFQEMENDDEGIPKTPTDNQGASAYQDEDE